MNLSELTWRETFLILWNYIPYQIRRRAVHVEIKESLEIEYYMAMEDEQGSDEEVDINTVSDPDWKEFLSTVGDLCSKEEEMP